MLEVLLSQPEGPTMAFARERIKIDELAETLAAFANGHGGHLIIGVSGRAKARPEGLTDPEAARELALEAALICEPPLIIPLPQLVALGEQTLLLVEVPPGLPHVYSVRGKYLRREGATNQPLLPDALRRLLLDRGEISWERNLPPDAHAEELDRAKIIAYARRVGPTAEADPAAFLLRRGCLSRPAAGPPKPTNAGLLLFARELEARYPQAEITLVRYQGRELADAFDREDVRDTLPEAIRRAERWLNEHMRKGSRMVGLEREDWTQFPPAAVREALVNAVAHRDYTARGEGVRIALFSDRLECYSPGRLPGHVTLANLREERYSRNETLVQVLADLGLIERLGYGIDRMVRQMEAANLPPPEFRETAAGFLVILRGQPLAEPPAASVDQLALARQGFNPRQIAAMAIVSEQQRISNSDLQEQFPEVSAETVRRDLADLVERGLLIRVGEKRATYYILK